MKYAPADGDGRKPYVRRCQEMNWDHSYVVYTRDAAEAKHAFRRGVYETVTVHRATPEDLELLDVEPGFEADR